jgi:predicted ATP-dependent protease
MSIQKIAADEAAPRCDPLSLVVLDGAVADNPLDPPGQSEAIESIRFAAGIPYGGFNLFVIGQASTGKLETTSAILRAMAVTARAPDDLCYRNNFDDPARPLCLRLPSGWGPRLRDALALLIDELKTAIPAVFDSEEYQARVSVIESRFSSAQEQTFGDLIAEARKRGVALWRTPAGFSFAPAKNGDVIAPEDFEKLPVAERERIGRAIEDLQQRLERLMRQVVGWRRERRSSLRQLNREVTVIAVGNLVDDLIRQYLPMPEVVDHLVALQRDVIDNAELFQPTGEGAAPDWIAIQSDGAAPARRYQLNVLVTHARQAGAPVVVEENPGLTNLLGRVEYLARFGALITDFGMIKPGAMHRAAGGYLLLDARRVLQQPFAWDALKRTLFTREIRIESVGQQMGLASTVTLEPQPVPFDAKVVLFGDRSLYMLLQSLDPDFGQLFKIAPEFGQVTDRTPDSVARYARWMRAAAAGAGLRPFGADALARVIDWSSRLAEDAGKLSLETRRIQDLLVEADQWAARRGAVQVTQADVMASLSARRARSGEIRRRVQGEILAQTLLIDTDGARVAQVNGLAVMALGEHSFGLPARITATTRLGDGSLIDIQREAQLGGPMHSKGVMILAAYLSARYSMREPLSLSGSLVFEQTYAEVDGDSASLAELCALLSSLAGLPLRQGFAVTGSVNQHGEVQAIGAVNEKIEGFFDVCEARAAQPSEPTCARPINGVVIPAANAKHLALRDEVVEAVRTGRFLVVAVSTVDEALAWLASDGMALPDVEACTDEVSDRIRRRLRDYSRVRQRFSGVGSAPERARRKH